MTSLSPHFYELLKNTVLATSGFTNVAPCDCKVISIEIFNRTKNRISETTLKRIFGFAYSKFKPSLFSMDAMAKYCGYRGWDDFCQKQDEGVNKSANSITYWDTLKASATKITNFTLQVIHNRSGIPYNHTIKRQFANNHFDEFLNSDSPATLLTAPTGYGKTIALCHWIEEGLALNAEGKTNDIFLFFSTSALINAFLSGRDLNHWILALLGYSADTNISALMEIQHKKDGCFFLIIDGLDDSDCPPKQFSLLIKQLVNILNLYQNEKWFKLILTMRSATWINNRHEIEDGDIKWFKGFIASGKCTINVPLLSPHEIEELCYKINPASNHSFTPETAEDFNHPLYLQFYYKLHKDNFSLTNVDHVSIYELVSTYVLNKVYLGDQSAEKILFLTGLVEAMDIPNKNYDVVKTKINLLIKQYHHAYTELINVGFIREINNSSDLHYNSYVQFANSKYLEYTYSKILLENNNFIFDQALINTINEHFTDSVHKVPVLKWCILYITRSGQLNNFDLLTQTNLTLNQKSDLILFMGDLIEKEYAIRSDSEARGQFFKQDCSPGLFNYFFGLEFINTNYKKTLLSLLKFRLKNHKKILIYTVLASSAVMRLDIDSLEEYLVKLRAIPPEDYNRFAINPLHCLDTLYTYLKSGVVKKDVFKELTQFYFNPPVEGNYFDNNVSNDVMYLLAAHTLLLTQNPKKVMRFINVLDKHYKKNDLSTAEGYNYIMQILIADCHFKFGENKEIADIYNSLSASYKNDKSAFTDYMKSSYYALRIKVNSLFRNYKHIIEDTISHSQVGGQYKFSRLYVLSIILNNPEVVNLYPKFCKQCEYDYARLLRETGVNIRMAEITHVAGYSDPD